MSRLLTLLALMPLLLACETDLVTGDDPLVLPAPTEVAAPAGLSRQVLDLVNDQRARGCRCGTDYLPPAAPLALNEALQSAALAHSRDMDGMRKMQHTGSDGSKVSERVSRTGYRWRRVGENIGWNYPTARAMVDGWIDSPGHCRNLMDARYREMGLARVGKYWTQVLASPQ